MDSRAAILKGTDDGPIVVMGKPEESELIKSIKHVGDSKMPEKADKLPDAQIAALEQWVRMGMPVDNEAPIKGTAQMEAAKTLWSLQPVKNAPPPAVQDPAHWVKSPIDQFILAKLEEKKIVPSPLAGKRTLLRRATFDLTGLPPTHPDGRVSIFLGPHRLADYDAAGAVIAPQQEPRATLPRRRLRPGACPGPEIKEAVNSSATKTGQLD